MNIVEVMGPECTRG